MAVARESNADTVLQKRQLIRDARYCSIGAYITNIRKGGTRKAAREGGTCLQAN
jgi:hypothetical protein